MLCQTKTIDSEVCKRNVGPTQESSSFYASVLKFVFVVSQQPFPISVFCVSRFPVALLVAWKLGQIPYDIFEVLACEMIHA